VKITKHGHSCVVIQEGADAALIDPGAFTPGAAELIAAATTSLITHEHLDHVDIEAVAAALANRSNLTVFAPQAVVAMLSDAAPGPVAGELKAVAAGDRFSVGELSVEVFGEIHAQIHSDIPQCANVGYLVGGRVFHPGDSTQVPDAVVDVLLLPTSGPWYSTGQAIDYVRAINPRRCIQIHESFASEMGQNSLALRFINPAAFTEVALELVPPGESRDL
jgi:L-ascorbate metabolism protein UlaG (beta-lactamase superfamily)